MSSTTSAAPKAGGEEKKLIGENFKRGAVKSGVCRGRRVDQVDMIKNESGTAERIARGIGGVLVALPTLGTALASESIREATIEPAFHGKVKRKIYYDRSKSQPESIPKRLGYNPKSTKEVQEYLARPEIRAQLQSDGQGNYFLIEHQRAPQGVSSFLFVPKGDFSKAESIKFYNAKNGKAITDAAQQLRAVRSYAATIAAIDEGWEKEVDEMAKRLIEKELGKDDEDMDTEGPLYKLRLEDKKEQIRKRRGPIVIDCKNYQARIYGQGVSLNTDISSTKTGTVIKFEDELQKTINHIHGKDMEHKEKLQGEKPFAKPPKDKTATATPFPAMPSPIPTATGTKPGATPPGPTITEVGDRSSSSGDEEWLDSGIDDPTNNGSSVEDDENYSDDYSDIGLFYSDDDK